MWGRREAECDPLAGLGERVVRIAPTVLSNHGTVKAVAFREREKSGKFGKWVILSEEGIQICPGKLPSAY